MDPPSPAPGARGGRASSTPLGGGPLPQAFKTRTVLSFAGANYTQADIRVADFFTGSR